jgi:hypothetical protein
MKKIEITNATGKYEECNCCSYNERIEGEPIFELRFKMGNMTQVVKLCERHTVELKSEIREKFY